jgi:hypothetical protein
MENKKQTAVEFLFQELNRIRLEEESGNISALDFFNQQNEAFAKSKQMEALELFDTYCNGFNRSRTALVFNKRDSYARLYLKEKFNIDFIKIIKQKL